MKKIIAIIISISLITGTNSYALRPALLANQAQGIQSKRAGLRPAATIQRQRDIAAEREHYIRDTSIKLQTIDEVLRSHVVTDELNQLLKVKKLEIIDAEGDRQLDILRALSELILQFVECKTGEDNAKKLSWIKNVLVAHPDISKLLIKYFKTKFNPEARVEERGPEAMDLCDEEMEWRLNVIENEDEKNILELARDIIRATTKTDYYLEGRTELNFRIQETRLLLKYDKKKNNFKGIPPFSLIWVHIPYGGFGAHVRYANIARGGIRHISAKRAYQQNNVLAMCADLAFKQHRKNRRIPEGGSKGVFIPYEGVNKEVVEIGYIDGLINCMRTHPRIVYASGSAAVDPLELGPDEETSDLMASASIRAKNKGVKDWRLLTTGKPSILGGISHKDNNLLKPARRGNRVTSQGVIIGHTIPMINYAQHRGLLQEGPIKITVTGGLDGDVASGLIENMIHYYGDNARILTFNDKSGVVFDPEGLDNSVLLDMYERKALAREYPREKLHKGGFVAKIDEKIPEGGYIILNSGILKHLNRRPFDLKALHRLGVVNEFRERARLGPDDTLVKVLNRTSTGIPSKVRVNNRYLRDVMCFAAKSDLLLAGGGPPGSVNDRNWKLFFDYNGRASLKINVNGANLFMGPSAARKLEAKGILIEADEDANLLGVEISSGVEYDLNMLYEPEELTPELMAAYFEQKLEKCLYNAKREFWALRQEAEKRPNESVVTEISPAFSEEIIKLTQDILNSELVDNRKEQYSELALVHLREYFPDVSNIDKKYPTTLDRVFALMHPDRIKAIAAATLAGEVVLRKGIGYVKNQMEKTGKNVAEIVQEALTPNIDEYDMETQNFNDFNKSEKIRHNQPDYWMFLDNVARVYIESYGKVPEEKRIELLKNYFLPHIMSPAIAMKTETPEKPHLQMRQRVCTEKIEELLRDRRAYVFGPLFGVLLVTMARAAKIYDVLHPKMFDFLAIPVVESIDETDAARFARAAEQALHDGAVGEIAGINGSAIESVIAEIYKRAVTRHPQLKGIFAQAHRTALENGYLDGVDKDVLATIEEIFSGNYSQPEFDGIQPIQAQTLIAASALRPALLKNWMQHIEIKRAGLRPIAAGAETPRPQIAGMEKQFRLLKAASVMDSSIQGSLALVDTPVEFFTAHRADISEELIKELLPCLSRLNENIPAAAENKETLARIAALIDILTPGQEPRKPAPVKPEEEFEDFEAVTIIPLEEPQVPPIAEPPAPQIQPRPMTEIQAQGAYSRLKELSTLEHFTVQQLGSIERTLVGLRHNIGKIDANKKETLSKTLAKILAKVPQENRHLCVLIEDFISDLSATAPARQARPITTPSKIKTALQPPQPQQLPTDPLSVQIDANLTELEALSGKEKFTTADMGRFENIVDFLSDNIAEINQTRAFVTRLEHITGQVSDRIEDIDSASAEIMDMADKLGTLTSNLIAFKQNEPLTLSHSAEAENNRREEFLKQLQEHYKEGSPGLADKFSTAVASITTLRHEIGNAINGVINLAGMLEIIAHERNLADMQSKASDISSRYNEILKLIADLRKEVERVQEADINKISVWLEKIENIIKMVDVTDKIDTIRPMLSGITGLPENQANIPNRLFLGAEKTKRLLQECAATITGEDLVLVKARQVSITEAINYSLFETAGTRGENVRVVKNFARDLPRVYADLDKLSQVFTNIIKNAVEAMKSKGRITIETRREEAMVVVRVTDTGPGISAAELEHVFGFVYTTKKEGTGLAISKRIMEAHGGTIRIESASGKGTTFIVELPAPIDIEAMTAEIAASA